MTYVSDHNDLIEQLGGGAVVAAGIRELPVTVRAWKPRNKIPPEYWPKVIEFAEAKGLTISPEWLMNTTPARRRATPSEAA